MFGNLAGPLASTNAIGLDMNKELPSAYGFIPRVFSDIVNRTTKDPRYAADTKITISFVEIYNEKIRDLLSGEVTSESSDMKVCEHPVST